MVTVNEMAAVSRIAACLAPWVTNGIIDEVAYQFGFRRLEASNKVKKIHILLELLLSDGRRRPSAADAITTIVMQAHHRTVAGTAGMTMAEADTIVGNMRALRLSVGELGREGWRAGLKSDRPPPPTPLAAPAAGGQGGAPGRATPDLQHPQRHDQAIAYISRLATDSSLSPQHRGLELEKILLDVLRKERLRPLHNIVNPGEQIDLSFAIRESYYLLESRWHREPQGLSALRDFSEKVRRKAEGTFGVLLSMSGFVGNINDTASQGQRLNCVGITHRELILVLEGMRTFVDVVQTARHEASSRSRFYTGLLG